MGKWFETVRVKVAVLDSPLTPLLGSPAPRSQNLVAGDVRDLRQIDTSERPDHRLHRVQIADAIEQGKPQVIVFATPQFCTSRMCGPAVEIVRRLLPAYGDRAVFTHQEIWQDFASKKLFPTVEEWRLQSEPWIFMVDGHGLIRAKFEGLVTVRLWRAMNRGRTRRLRNRTCFMLSTCRSMRRSFFARTLSAQAYSRRFHTATRRKTVLKKAFCDFIC